MVTLAYSDGRSITLAASPPKSPPPNDLWFVIAAVLAISLIVGLAVYGAARPA